MFLAKLTKTTTGALDTVLVTAEGATKLVTILSDSLDMAARAVETANQKSIIDNINEMVGYQDLSEQRHQISHAREIHEMQKELKNQELKATFDSLDSKYEAARKRIDAKLGNQEVKQLKVVS